MTDLVLAGARLPGSDGAVDVTIVNGAIASIASAGPAGAAKDARGGSVERVELDGRWVVPGLWDNHVHFTQWAAVSRRLDVGGARSAAEAAALVGAALRDREPGSAGEMLVGYGFRDGLWPDVPTAALLDSVTGPHPVVLVSGDLHCCWLNTAALASVGSPGHPDGVLREEEAFAVHRALDDVPVATSDAWALEAARAAAARGVVGIVDLEMAWNHEAWERRLAAGHDLLRVEFGVYPQHLERAIAEGLRTGDPVGEAGLVTVGPFKVITDGSLNTRTAYCFGEYPGLEGTEHGHGQLTVPPDELDAWLSRAAAAGLVPAVHAIGDHANRLVLDAFEALRARRVLPEVARDGSALRRPTLEHAQLLAEGDIGRFAALDVVASVQPEHAMDDRDVADRYWAGRTGRSFALASLVAAGAELALGSDAPVAPLDPWITIAAAVTRTRDGRTPWHPEQRIPAATALAASTRPRRPAATASPASTGPGRSASDALPGGLSTSYPSASSRRTSYPRPDGLVAVGDTADLAVLDLDPLTAAPEALRTTPVALTLLAGRPTHRTL